MTIDPVISLIIQVILTILFTLMGFILNGMKGSLDKVSIDLKILNDSVLGKYVTTESVDRWREGHIKENTERWATHLSTVSTATLEQRRLDHELRNEIQIIKVTLATMQAKENSK